MPTPTRTFAALIALLSSISAASAAQAPGAGVVRASIAGPAKAEAGKPFKLLVNLDIQKGYHIQANTVKEPYIPTIVSVQGPRGFRVSGAAYPKPMTITQGGEKLQVFEGRIQIKVPVSSMPGHRGRLPITVNVNYQACNDQACFPPSSARITGSVYFVPPAAPRHAHRAAGK